MRSLAAATLALLLLSCGKSPPPPAADETEKEKIARLGKIVTEGELNPAWAAAMELGRMGEPALPLLTGWLHSGDDSLRVLAGEGLVLAGPEGIRTLLAYDHPDTELALKWAAWRDETPVVRVLGSELLEGRGRARALRILFRVGWVGWRWGRGDPSMAAAEPGLRACLADSRPDVRFMAVEVLRFAPAIHPETRGPILACLKDPDEEVRRQALYTIRRHGSLDLAGEDREWLPEVIGFLGDPEATLAARELLRRQRAVELRCLPHAVRLLHHARAEVRISAIGIVRDLGPEAQVATPRLTELRDDFDRKVSEAATAALAAAHDQPPEDAPPPARGLLPLWADLRSESWEERFLAAAGLGRLGEEASPVVPDLERLLDDPVRVVREAARWALRRIRGY